MDQKQSTVVRREIRIADDKNGPRNWILCFNLAAHEKLEATTKRPSWFTLAEPSDSVTRIAHLIYAGSETFRYRTGLQISWEEFLHGDYLPVAYSDEWHRLESDLWALLDETFPAVAETRKRLRFLATQQIVSSDTDLSTGTS